MMIDELRQELQQFQQDQQRAAAAVEQAKADFQQITGAVKYLQAKIAMLENDRNKEGDPDVEVEVEVESE